jgi:hypothetical protein
VSERELFWLAHFLLKRRWLVQACNNLCRGSVGCSNFTWHSPAAPVFGSSCFLFSRCNKLAGCYSCFRWLTICCIICYTVIRFVWVSAKFDTCTVVSVNGTLVEDKMRRLKSECTHFSYHKCPIFTHDGASAKFSTNSHETDNSVGSHIKVIFSHDIIFNV